MATFQLSQQDINIRLQMSSCFIADKAVTLNNNLRFGIACKDDIEKLQIASAWIDMIAKYDAEYKMLNVTTISFSERSGTYYIFDSADGFVDAGIKVGDQITLSGSTSNDGTYTVLYVAAGTLKVTEVITSESAGDEITITEVTTNCFTEDQLQSLFHQLSSYLSICYPRQTDTEWSAVVLDQGTLVTDGDGTDTVVDDGGDTIVTNNTIDGCMDPVANNYNPNADNDDGTCDYTILGCIDPDADNYNPFATQDDGSCFTTPQIPGCTSQTALNYDPAAEQDDGSCIEPVEGCMDTLATNYNVNANVDDGSCSYVATEDTCNALWVQNGSPIFVSGYSYCQNTVIEFAGVLWLKTTTGCVTQIDNPDINTTDWVACSSYVQGCIDTTASNYLPMAVADCAGTISGANTDCCQYCDSLSATITVIDSNNNAGTNGSVTITISGGTGPYTISQYHPDPLSSPIVFATQAGIVSGSPYTYTNINPGAYGLKIKDSNGCKILTEKILVLDTYVEINNPPTPNVPTPCEQHHCEWTFCESCFIDPGDPLNTDPNSFLDLTVEGYKKSKVVTVTLKNAPYNVGDTSLTNFPYWGGEILVAGTSSVLGGDLPDAGISYNFAFPFSLTSNNPSFTGTPIIPELEFIKESCCWDYRAYNMGGSGSGTLGAECDSWFAASTAAQSTCNNNTLLNNWNTVGNNLIDFDLLRQRMCLCGPSLYNTISPTTGVFVIPQVSFNPSQLFVIMRLWDGNGNTIAPSTNYLTNQGLPPTTTELYYPSNMSVEVKIYQDLSLTNLDNWATIDANGTLTGTTGGGTATNGLYSRYNSSISVPNITTGGGSLLGQWEFRNLKY